MNQDMHLVAPEDVMAFLDGELSAGSAELFSAHVQACPECQSIAVKLEAASRSLVTWTVSLPAAQAEFERRLSEAARKKSSGSVVRQWSRRVFLFRLRWIFTTIAAALVILSVWVVRAPSRIHLDEPEMRVKLKHEVTPTFPKGARDKHIQGTVKLHLIVGTDGTVKRVELLSGDPLLARTSLAAVRQWEFEPTLVNGKPVEVDTTAEVTFLLY